MKARKIMEEWATSFLYIIVVLTFLFFPPHYLFTFLFNHAILNQMIYLSLSISEWIVQSIYIYGLIQMYFSLLLF